MILPSSRPLMKSVTHAFTAAESDLHINWRSRPFENIGAFSQTYGRGGMGQDFAKAMYLDP